MNAGVIRIRRAGSAIVTDLGRREGPRFGVPAGGVLDQASAALANTLAGNPAGVPLIEMTALDLEFDVQVDVLIAVAGATVELTVDGAPHNAGEPISVQAGQSVALHSMTDGLRTYIAVHGSFDVPYLLGSCAPDTVLGFGARLADGDELMVRVRTEPILNPVFSTALYRLGALHRGRGRSPIIEVTDGPDLAEFGDTALRLFADAYTVTPASNHIGLRLAGEMPERQVSGEVLSRGVPVGAVEAPPGDELLVLHRGRGVTAGYPVLAVVTATSLNALAQVRPGEEVRFRSVSTQRAAANARLEAARLEDLRRRVGAVFASLGRPLSPPVELPHPAELSHPAERTTS